MNPILDPLRIVMHLALSATATVLKVASGAAQAVQLLLGREPDDDRFQAGAVPARPAEREPGAAAPGGTGRRTPSPGATPRRATVQADVVQSTTAPPEPTAAAGASGGVAGTADAPGAAAAVDAPDPTAATSAERAPTAPRRRRTTRDVEPESRADRSRTEPTRSEIDRRRAEQRDADPADDDALVETEGAADPGATLRVGAPWDGYDQMKATDIVHRVRGEDDAAKAVVRLYESTHKQRKSILRATEG